MFGMFARFSSSSFPTLISASMVYSDGWMRSYLLPPASSFDEHLLVRGVVLHVDLDAGFLGEAVDDFLRHVLRPAEEIEDTFLFRLRMAGHGDDGEKGERERGDGWFS